MRCDARAPSIPVCVCFLEPAGGCLAIPSRLLCCGRARAYTHTLPRRRRWRCCVVFAACVRLVALPGIVYSGEARREGKEGRKGEERRTAASRAGQSRRRVILPFSIVGGRGWEQWGSVTSIAAADQGEKDRHRPVGDIRVGGVGGSGIGFRCAFRTNRATGSLINFAAVVPAYARGPKAE